MSNDARQHTAAVARNRDPILEVLRRHLPRSGVVLAAEQASTSISSLTRRVLNSSFNRAIRIPRRATALMRGSRFQGAAIFGQRSLWMPLLTCGR